MRGWLLLGAGVAIAVILPLVAMGQTDWVRLAGQIVLTVELLLLTGGAALFGYICLKAQATKWGVGLLVVALLCVLAVYMVWAGKLPFF
ncbi:MAG: hypothetical protein AB1476_01810 [Candidatus Hadarchaeota archaeon]